MSFHKDQLLANELPEFFKDLTKGSQSAPETALAQVSRRQFFKISSIAGGGLAIGLTLGNNPKAKAQFGSGNISTLSPYVQIQTNGRINIFSKNPECGQGIKTGLPLIIAEELDVSWEDVDVVQAEIDGARYGAQFAGGSMSTPMNWMAMRQAGATARAMILSAAAARLSVPLSELSTGESKVKHVATGREFGYGEFADLAATMPVPAPDTIVLKDPANFVLLGKRFTGVDNLDIVIGKPLFGADTVRPNMVYATYTKSPRIGGVPVSFNEAHIKSLPGVVDAFIVHAFQDAKIFNTAGGVMFAGVAVVAKSTWAGIKAKRELEIEWDLSNAETANWSDLVENALAVSGGDGETELANKGDVDQAMADASSSVEAFYEYPYIAHAQLEPETCTAVFANGEIEVWAPSQVPDGGRSGAAARIGIAPENSTLHQTRIGGGFGRKLANDYVHEVAAIAQKMEGVPVKLQWTREDEMAHDYYRPGGFHSFKAAIDEDGRLSAWQDHFISMTGDGKAPMPSAELSPVVFPGDVLSNVKITQTLQDAAIPTGPMRAPGSNAIAFAFQSFMHECSLAAGKDHVEFLLETLGEQPAIDPNAPPGPPGMDVERAKSVISAVADRAGWGKDMPAGRALGLSFYYCHSGYVAQVADVSVEADKALKVNKVWAVADFGFIHNLSSAENQMEGGIIDGLSQLMSAKITFKNGAIEQQNFHQYPLIRMPSAPELDIVFLDTAYPPTGAGEPAMPPLLAAVSNAIYTASGDRVRKMPLSESGYSFV